MTKEKAEIERKIKLGDDVLVPCMVCVSESNMVRVRARDHMGGAIDFWLPLGVDPATVIPLDDYKTGQAALEVVERLDPKIGDRKQAMDRVYQVISEWTDSADEIGKMLLGIEGVIYRDPEPVAVLTEKFKSVVTSCVARSRAILSSDKSDVAGRLLACLETFIADGGTFTEPPTTQPTVSDADQS